MFLFSKYPASKFLWIVGLSLFALLAQAVPNQRNFQQIMTSGELRVGVALFTPWTLRAKDGQLVGSEMDMANRLTKDMGLKLNASSYEWQQLIPALEQGDIDIIVAGMAIQPNRALRVNFSQPYAEAGIGMAVNKMLTAKFSSLDDLKNSEIHIGSVQGSVAAAIAKRMFKKATQKSFTTRQQAVAALLADDLHAIIDSNPQPKYLALKHPEEVAVPLTEPLMSSREGFAVRKGDYDFVNFLNAWIVSRQVDGWIGSTRSYWFESLEWQDQVEP